MGSLSRWANDLAWKTARRGFRLIKPLLRPLFRYGMRRLNESQRIRLAYHCLGIYDRNAVKGMADKPKSPRFSEKARMELTQDCLAGLSKPSLVTLLAETYSLLSESELVRLQDAMGFAARSSVDLNECEEFGVLPSFSTGASKQELLERDDLPILLGPWLSEVGFELLYWTPFVRQYLAKRRIPKHRVIALSRGGAGGWYADLAESYLDVFDLCSPEEFLHGNQEREMRQAGKKQYELDPFENRLIQASAQALGLNEYLVLHPSLMYRYLKPFWAAEAPLGRIKHCCKHQRIAHRYPRPEAIPFDRYVAVKLYHSKCFPQTPENTRFTKRLIHELAARHNVVLLNTGHQLDDHTEAQQVSLPNVFDASAIMSARNNLDLQSAIVEHSQGLYATYGGFSYLGPLLGVPSISFYSSANFLREHLDLAHRVLNERGRSLFTAISTDHLEIFLGSCELHSSAKKYCAA